MSRSRFPAENSLPGVRPGGMNSRVERLARPPQPVDRQRSRLIGGPCEALGTHQRQGEHGRRRLRAVDERQPLFRAQHNW
jgi:hypothetical protein